MVNFQSVSSQVIGKIICAVSKFVSTLVGMETKNKNSGREQWPTWKLWLLWSLCTYQQTCISFIFHYLVTYWFCKPAYIVSTWIVHNKLELELVNLVFKFSVLCTQLTSVCTESVKVDIFIRNFSCTFVLGNSNSVPLQLFAGIRKVYKFIYIVIIKRFLSWLQLWTHWLVPSSYLALIVQLGLLTHGSNF